MYTGAWFWDPDAGGSSIVSDHPLWVSGYTSTPPMPKGLHLLFLLSPLLFWQATLCVVDSLALTLIAGLLINHPGGLVFQDGAVGRTGSIQTKSPSRASVVRVTLAWQAALRRICTAWPACWNKRQR